MPETSAQLRDRAAHYRKLARFATDARLIGVILEVAGELEARAKEVDHDKVVPLFRAHSRPRS